MEPADYDRAACAMLESIDPAVFLAEGGAAALLDVTGAILKRKGPLLVDSRAAAAERLLQLLASAQDPNVIDKGREQLRRAWSQLEAAAEAGEDSIDTTPSLPARVVFPAGTDPSEIENPKARERAERAAARHQKAVAIWNARNRALDHLRYLAAIVRSLDGDLKASQALLQDVAAELAVDESR